MITNLCKILVFPYYYFPQKFRFKFGLTLQIFGYKMGNKWMTRLIEMSNFVKFSFKRWNAFFGSSYPRLQSLISSKLHHQFQLKIIKKFISQILKICRLCKDWDRCSGMWLLLKKRDFVSFRFQKRPQLPWLKRRLQYENLVQISTKLRQWSPSCSLTV